MAMNTAAMAGMGIAVVNSILLAVLTAVWLRNYRQFRSTMILGLVGFSVVLLVENLVGVYFFFDSMSMLYATDRFVGEIVLVMRSLELVAVAFLTYATLK